MLRNSFSRDERGQTVVIVGLTVIVLLGFLGLVADVAWYQLNLARVQRAADAGALAGVVYLPGSVSNAVQTGPMPDVAAAADEEQAQARARQIAIVRRRKRQWQNLSIRLVAAQDPDGNLGPLIRDIRAAIDARRPARQPDPAVEDDPP